MPVPKSTPARRRSNVSSHSYNPETGHLDVTFHNGRTYRYDGVAPELADRMGSAESLGGFLHAHVIGKHDATEISG